MCNYHLARPNTYGCQVNSFKDHALVKNVVFKISIDFCYIKKTK